MLKKQMEKYIANHLQSNNIELFEFEETYALTQQLLPEKSSVVSKTITYETIERCTKETEEVIALEKSSFLNESLCYLKTHADEFIFVESTSFELIGVDGFALECDDVFGTYTVLFGLKIQKKYGPVIKSFLDNTLQGDGVKYSIMFSSEDGLWDMNISLDYLDGFDDQQSFEEILKSVYHFVFNLAKAVEDEI